MKRTTHFSKTSQARRPLALQVSVGKWEGYGWKWEGGTGYPTTSPHRNNCSKIGWGEYWISSLIKTKQIHRSGLLVFLA